MLSENLDARPLVPTGEIFGSGAFESIENPKHFEGEPSLNKEDRWIENIVLRFEMLSKAGALSGNKRIKGCCKHRHKNAPEIKVMISPESGNPHYTGYQHCGSLWACPNCAPKITEKRRKQLHADMEIAKQKGAKPYMMTLTIQHYKMDLLPWLLEKLGKAYDRMRANQPWRKWAARIGLVGTVKALEVTNTEANGWHVHLHFLLFCMGADAPQSRDLLLEWQESCVAVGLRKPNEHGVHIDRADNADDYLAKWAEELTKSHIKRTRTPSGKGRTPMQLLRDALDAEEEAAPLWIEYYKAFKGKKQLVYSASLREFLGRNDKEEKTDQQLADEEIEHAVPVVGIPAADWVRVVRFRARALVLILAKYGGAEAVLWLLDNLKRQARELDLIEIFA